MQITIPKKIGGTGSIYNIASDQYDIIIDMGKKYQYAVVTPAYYNIKPTRHTNLKLALDQAKRLHAKGYRNILLIDRDSDYFDWDYGNNIYLLN